MPLKKPRVQILSHITDLLENETVHLTVQNRYVGWYKLKKLDELPTDKRFNVKIIKASNMLKSVMEPTHAVVHSGLNTIERNFVRYKLDSFVLANSKVSRKQLFKEGYICVASAASTVSAAVFNSAITLAGKLDGNRLYYYTVPFLCGDDVALAYDTYPLLQVNGYMCSVFEFASIQQFMDLETQEIVAAAVPILTNDTDYTGDVNET